MLIENSLGEFSDAQLLSGAAESDNYVDLELAKHKAGQAPLWLWLRTNVAEDFGESETFIFAFESDSDSGFATNLWCHFALCDTDGSAIATADPESTPLKTAGLTIWASTLPYNCQRYVRWYYTHATGTAVLTVDALLLAGPPPQNMSGDQVCVSNVSTI